MSEPLQIKTGVDLELLCQRIYNTDLRLISNLEYTIEIPKQDFINLCPFNLEFGEFLKYNSSVGIQLQVKYK